MEPSEKVKTLVRELKARTAADAYAVKLEPGKTPGLLDSKFGGLPYWPKGMDYPADRDGNKLYLLAQINFDQFPAEAPLPQKGMLQFFLRDDDVFGINFDQQDDQDGFRVIYHPDIDCSVTREQVLALNIPTNADAECSPVFGETAVRLEKTVSYMGPEDYRFDDLTKQLVRELFGEEAENLYRYLGSDDFEYLCDQCQPIGHHLLGHPFFTQYDPRPKDSPYDTLLFQMDSDVVDHEDVVLWGDCGVANFFINGKDLEKLDFSRVLYNWDCC